MVSRAAFVSLEAGRTDEMVGRAREMALQPASLESQQKVTINGLMGAVIPYERGKNDRSR